MLLGIEQGVQNAEKEIEGWTWYNGMEMHYNYIWLKDEWDIKLMIFPNEQKLSYENFVVTMNLFHDQEHID